MPQTTRVRPLFSLQCGIIERVAPEFTKKSWMPAYAGMTSLQRKPESSPLLVSLLW